MKISVTGTKDGANSRQIFELGMLIARLKGIEEFHHGKCVGVDISLARLMRTIRESGYPHMKIIAHPGLNNGALEAEDPYSDEELPPKTNFARNRDLVDLLGPDDLLIVVPKVQPMTNSGGKSYTFSYAMKHHKHLIILWPDGSIEEKNAP